MKWTKEKIDWLQQNYPLYGKMYCVQKLQVTESVIRTKASLLKLKLDQNGPFFKDFHKRAAQSNIGKKRPIHSKILKDGYASGRIKSYRRTKEQRENTGLQIKEYIRINGHPRGMLGKKHSEEFKKSMSVRVKKLWETPNFYLNSQEYKQKVSDKSTFSQMWRKSKHTAWKTHQSWCLIGEKKCFFLSSWEKLYAGYLEHLKQIKEIIDWEYEVDTFWFWNIKRGVRSYTPDFKILTNAEEIEYHEVKGNWDQKSRTKKSRMKKYYKDITLKYFDKTTFFDKKTISLLEIFCKKYVNEITKEEYNKISIRSDMGG